MALTNQARIREKGWSRLRLDHVSKEFEGLHGGTYAALHDVSIEVRRGDFYCLLGPSGCGKSTILNLIAGFESATGGQIEIECEEGAARWWAALSAPMC